MLMFPPKIRFIWAAGLAFWSCGPVFAQATPNTEPKGWTADPAVVSKLSRKRAEFNYDETKVPAYELPDPLTMRRGEPVETADQWFQKRRPELMDLFRESVYGRRPDIGYTVAFSMVSEKAVFDGKAVGRTMKATIGIGERTFAFRFVAFIPSDVEKPAPAVIFINNRYFTPVDKITGDDDTFYPVKNLIDRGYATASFFTSDVDPDSPSGYGQGIRAFFADAKLPEASSWGSLSAWGFAASRVLDYLETVRQVDASRACVVGHSRGGKASLWAAAEDRRFAVAYSNHSGCGGAALSRRVYGETVERITTNFPHWFCKNFAGYSNRESDLPVDQHELISLIAPRGVYVASADQDLWADPRGEYLALCQAGPVFTLLGVPSLGGEMLTRDLPLSQASPPPLDVQKIAGPTGYHIGSGGHGLKHTDWALFLDHTDGLFQ